MFGVQLDGIDHQVEFVGTIDLSRDAIVMARSRPLRFGEVMEPINAACRVVFHEQDDTGWIFRPREQKQMIGAEVEHDEEGNEDP